MANGHADAPVFWFGIYDTFPSDPSHDLHVVQLIPMDGDMSEISWANHIVEVIAENGEFYIL
jgi:hypothetical protein